MKKRVWVVSIFCAVCFGALAGLNDGLIAYYPFQGNAQDVSTNQKFTIKWSSVGGKQYDLIRSTALPMDSYTTVAAGIYATAPTNSFTDDDATNATHFYRIQLKE